MLKLLYRINLAASTNKTEDLYMDTMKSTAKKTSSNQSAVKTMKILEVLSANREPMRLYDLSKTADMNASTALRFLNSLIVVVIKLS